MSQPRHLTVEEVEQRAAGPAIFSDLQGLSQLATDAVTGVTDVVEDLHCTIARVSPLVGASPPGRARGIAGLVYRSVRGVTQAVGLPLGAALGYLAPLSPRHAVPSLRREAAVATLNGVVGDHLVASGNPLAIPMRMRRDGRPLSLGGPVLAADASGSKLLVLVHGLCMNDLSWARDGHDYGAALARDLGYTPLYLHYNTGLRVGANGRAFAGLMERLVAEWPLPISDLVIVGHSMGGLVARSACHQADAAGHAWRGHLRKLICLGTPHHGAPLERAGSRVDAWFGVSPYTAPFARLGQIRSAGVQDLRYGAVLDEEPLASEAGGQRDGARIYGPQPLVPLPEGVSCFAIAATKQPRAGGTDLWMPGDGLVPVNSALGQHRDAARTLPIPAARQHVCYGLNHFGLLSSREVYDRLHGWMATG